MCLSINTPDCASRSTGATTLQELIDASPAPPHVVAKAVFKLRFNADVAQAAEMLGVAANVLSRSIHNSHGVGRNIRSRVEGLLEVSIWPPEPPARAPKT